MRMANACTRHNADERPTQLSSLLGKQKPRPWQHVALVVMALTALALAAYIAKELAVRYGAESGNSIQAPAQGTAGDGNRAIDYSQWPR